MGNFYVNFTVCSEKQEQIVACLESNKRIALVSPPKQGMIVVCDQETEEQDANKIVALANSLSKDTKSAVLAAMNHDDSVFFYWVSKDGKVISEYISRPGYFDGNDDEPRGADAALLCQVFGGNGDVEAVEEVLMNPDYTFECERHEQLIAALGLSDHALCAGFNYIAQGECPADLSEEDFVSVG